jgi:uncharacterized protein (DUF302 family)
MKLNIFFISTLLLISSPLYAAKVADTPASKTEVNKAKKVEPSVFERRIKRSEPAVYKQLFSALENNGYYVVFETNIGKNLSRFAQRWGDDYNRNKLDSIRSLIFCNGWYANRVGNADPKMLALCPMHITVTHKKGITSILYVRPSQVAIDSPASKVATELEQDVVRIINSIPYRD